MIVPDHLHMAVIKTSRGQARCMTAIQKVYLQKKKNKETGKKKRKKHKNIGNGVSLSSSKIFRDFNGRKNKLTLYPDE